MVGLRVIITVSVLMALILTVVGNKNRRLHARHFGGGGDGDGDGDQMPCTNDPDLYEYYSPCSTTTQSSSTTTTTVSTTSSTNPTLLERAHWCRFNNGTYLPLGYSYMQSTCSVCQCTNSRMIRCQPFQCMPTYCIDNTMPLRKSGQCCTQCGYELITNSCVYNNISFPHGAIIKVVENKMQCWCQLGNIECRNYMGSLLQGLDVWADGAAVYIIIIVVVVVILFGLLLCCGCTIGFYYYYQRNQNAFQQAYDQYANSAGWQPMNEGEENVVDAGAEEKRIEAEKYQFENSVNEAIPPPYIGYNGSHFPEQGQKQL